MCVCVCVCERERTTEKEMEIKAAEGSGWERGKSQPFSDERNPTNPLNDKHVSVSPIPGLCSIYACVFVLVRDSVCVCVCVCVCMCLCC